MRTPIVALWLCLVLGSVLGGCELVADFDRSKLAQAPDAGEPEAGRDGGDNDAAAGAGGLDGSSGAGGSTDDDSGADDDAGQ